MLNQKHNAYLTLTEIAEALPVKLFYRVHKSFIINYNKISLMDGNQIILIDKTVLQIGNTYREAFLNIIQNLTIKSARQVIFPMNRESLILEVVLCVLNS